MIKIEIFENKKEWNKFLDENNYLSFLQDFEYGEVEKSLGREVLRLGVFKNKSDLVGVCQIIGYSGKRAGLVIHHGPVIKEEYFEEGLKKILGFLKKDGFNKRYFFLRVNPIATQFEKEKIFKKLGFILAPTYSVTENFWVKEINSEENMLREMNESHRKLVLESLKKPYLEIEKTKDLKKLEIFWEIYQYLAKRKNFVPYPKEFIFKEFEFFSQENKALLFLGKAEEKYYSSALIIFSHNIAFYHHSASYEIKEPLNYKMQWEIIKEAKERGCKYYNFWGVARKEVSSHPWYGLTQFKKGFGGKLIKLLPTFDYRFKNRYWLIYIYEKIKRSKL